MFGKPQCKIAWCKSENIAYVRGKPSRTRGFHPDYECQKCGFRWIELRAGGGLRELHEAVKEFRGRTDRNGGFAAPRGTEF